MSKQINLKMSNRVYASAAAYAESQGFDSQQEFIRELIRERLFVRESEAIGGHHTYLASEQALAKNWLSPEEDKAWAHLQR